MTDSPEDAGTDELMRFVNDRVAPLAKAFAQTPLMQLRVRTAEGRITLVKATARISAGVKSPSAKPAHAPRFIEGEPGRAYDTINAEAVGVFRAAPDAPEFGDRIAADRVLGFVEALKLRNPVSAGAQCWFIAQAVEDGQAVDFGEVLFVVERGESPPLAESTGESQNGSATYVDEAEELRPVE